MRDNSLFQDTPFEKFVACVEDRDDPLQLGRCRIRIIGYHIDDKTQLPTEDLPWAYPIQPITSAANSGVGTTPLGITLGSWVVGYFLDGRDQQIPVFDGTFGSFQRRTPNQSIASPETLTQPVVPNDTNNSVIVDNGNDPVNTNNIKSPTGWVLGQTSEKYESGGRGCGTINNYASSNDPGGASYGSYQFASFLPKVRPDGKTRGDSRNTQFVSYLKQSKFANSFSGLTPATPEFDSKWKSVASQNKNAFTEDQHEYIKLNFYLVMLSKLKQRGLDLTGFGAAVQDLVWSSAVQLGSNRLSVFLDPLQGKTQLTDTDIVTLVSDFKINNVTSLFSSSTSAIQSSVKNRYISEKSALLALCNGVVVPSSTYEKGTTYGGKYDSRKDTSNKNVLHNAITGYSDPSGEYPRVDYNDQQDTNKLARNVIAKTAAEKKSFNRAYGMPLAAGDSFDQPSNPYAAQYPYNKVTESESGHVFEVDDTPGSERINQYHTSGTFNEIDAHGNQVNRIVGSAYTIIDRNGFISITGKASVSVVGSINLFIGGDANIEIQGNTLINAHNDVVLEANGSVDVSSQENISIHSAKNLYLESDNDIYFKAAGSIKSESGNETHSYSGTSSYTFAGNDIHSKSEGNNYVSANGNVDIKSSGNVNIDGTMLYENSGTAASAADAKPSSHSLIGVPHEGRYSGQEVIVSELIAPSRTDSEDYLVEAPHDQYTLSQAQKDANSASGTVVDGVTNDTTTVTEGTTSTADTAYLKTLVSVPNEYRLSANFTLADVSSRAVATPTQVVSQFGLRVGEIVANLQLVAVYCLEPIKKKYPSMIVTSGFRNYSKGSDHVLGSAVDIQFPGMTKSDYHQIAKDISKIIPFDQLLLEYKSSGTGLPWIHISYKESNNRSSVMTFYNNKAYANSLVNLA